MFSLKCVSSFVLLLFSETPDSLITLPANGDSGKEHIVSTR
jgi:hypothetical protein